MDISSPGSFSILDKSFRKSEHSTSKSIAKNSPKIYLIGLQRCGKSSIANVVFEKMLPNETLFLENTKTVVKYLVNNSNYVQFEIWDIPGPFDSSNLSIESFFASLHIDFSKCDAIVFIIDSQDDYSDALNMLHATVMYAYNINEHINFEVFVHKIDGLVDDFKIEAQRDIHQKMTDELFANGFGDIRIGLHLTSIYDYSIFKSFSKVIQKLFPHMNALENLLNIFNTNSNIEKSFLFDVNAKIYVASDSIVVDMQTYELCCDMIDVLFNFSYIYGLKDGDTKVEAIDDQSYCVIKLNINQILYLRQIDKYLALVSILREESYKKTGLLEYNFICLKDSIKQIFEISNRKCNGDYFDTDSLNPLNITGDI